MASQRILREYVRSVLAEDDGGGGDYGGYGFDFGMMGDSPYGMSWGGPGLFKQLVQPFADVFTTGKAALENIAARTRTLAKVSYEAVATTLIPILSSDYDKIFKEERAQLDKIEEKYSEVFERTAQALGNDDALISAFALNPALVLTKTLFQKAPQVALGVLELLAGENENLRAALKRLHLTSHPTKGAKSSSSTSSQNDWGGGYGGGGGWGYGGDYGGHSGGGDAWGESIIREIDEETPQQKLQRAISDPQLLRQLQETPLARSMKADAMKVIQKTASDLIKRYKQISSTRTIDDVTRLFPKIDRTKLAELDKLPPEQKDPAEKAIVDQVHASAKAFYMSNVARNLDHMRKIGLSDDHPLVQGYTKVLNIVKSS
jgi:hypothetical protein